MSGPHVLQIVADGAPGGGTTMVLGLCQDLLAQGLRVSLITAPGSAAAQRGRALGAEVHELDFFTSRFDLRLAKRLTRLVQKLEPALIHLHGARAANPFWQGQLGKLRTPLVYTVHGYHFLRKPWPLRLLGCYAEWRIARRVDALVFVSEADRAIAHRYGILKRSEAARIVYNGIDAAELASAIGAPTSAGPTHDLVYVSRMVEQKNPLFMLEIMRCLAPRGVTLLMAGGGELEPEVRSRAHAYGLDALITFTGGVDRPAALRAQASAKLLVFPSLWEGLPITPMEAMFLGVPVVASHIGGTDEVVRDGDTGALVRGFRADDFAARIAALLADEPGRQRLRERGKQVVAERFMREACTRGYVDTYRELLPNLFPVRA